MQEESSKKIYKNKIILIILIILLFISCVVLTHIIVKHDKLKQNNEKIINEIEKIQDNTTTIDNEFNSNSTKLDNKKTEIKEKIEEYNIWLEMKEKIK